jgi:dinuclear metal center YbgI/SA1388 family protein
MILSEIIKYLDTILRKELAFETDNSGFLIGNTHKDIKKILIALDGTDEVIDEAIELQAGLLIVHHPLIYNPLKNITSQEKIQSKILKLIENGIAVYAAHTNYDIMPGGLNQLIAEKIGLKNIGILEPLQGMDGSETLQVKKC